jgi:hypothetical protein
VKALGDTLKNANNNCVFFPIYNKKYYEIKKIYS